MGIHKPAGTGPLFLTIAVILFIIGFISCQIQEMEIITPPDMSTSQYPANSLGDISTLTVPARISATPSIRFDQGTPQMLASSSVHRTPTLLITATILPPKDVLIQDKGEEDMATPFAHSSLLQSQGVLYVRVEYHQAQLGLSVVMGGGQFRPLTTAYEWWIDTQNLERYRRATSELLEDGPHLVGADGANGATSWWIVDWTRGITLPERHEGQPPFGLSSLDDFAAIFARDGRPLIEAAQSKKEEVQIVGQTEQPLWGTVLTIRQTSVKTGQVLTATVRAEAPNVVLESVTLDRQGQLFESVRITNWEWFDPAQFDTDFWLYPPKGIPIGPGNLKP